MTEILELPKRRFVEVELATLEIDHGYQRPLRPSAKKIKKNFCPEAAGALIVAERVAQKRRVIDGQQRCWAMKELGITHWPAIVFDSGGPEFEALIFRKYNSGEGRTQLTSRDIFKAAVASNDPVALAVCQLTAEAGLKISSVSGGNHGEWPYLQAVGMIYNGVRTHGVETSRRLFKVLREGWQGQKEAVQNFALRVLFTLYGQLGDRIDDERMARTLAKIEAAKVQREARLLHGVAAINGARVILHEYNKRLLEKNRLAMPDSVQGGDVTSPEARAEKERMKKEIEEVAKGSQAG
jgi:hypothetical protein